MSGWNDEKIKELKKKIQGIQKKWNIIKKNKEFNDKIKR